jgi:hypothetical protein
MANTIRIKRSSVAGKIPTLSDVSAGELAVNIADGKLFTRKESGGVASIVEIGSSGGGTSSSASGAILLCQQTISESIVLTSGYNGVSVGPVEVATGVTVEVPTNATWAVI